jgi:replicative DNA helicase
MSAQELTTKFTDRFAERRLIGALLLGRQPDGLRPWHFSDARHRAIFNGIKKVIDQGVMVDLASVEGALVGKEKIYGGVAYLAELASVADYAGYRNWMEHVIDLGVRRAHVFEQQKAIKRLIDGDNPDAVRADLSHKLDHLTTATSTARPMDLGAQLESIMDRYSNPLQVWGMRSGIAAIDDDFGGIHKGQEIVIAGEPGAGKSMFFMQVGYQLAGLRFWNTHFNLEAHPGNIYSMEMAEDQVVRRLIAAQAKVEWKRLMTGKYNDDDELRRVTDAIARIEKVPVYISDDTDWTTDALRADLIKHIDERGIEWAIVDYMGLLKDRANTTHEKETRISIALHDMARDLNIALLCVDALNKASMDKRVAGIGAVKGSGQKIYDADVIAFLERPTSKSSDPARRILRFTKVREGDSRLKIPLTLNGAQKRFDQA